MNELRIFLRNIMIKFSRLLGHLSAVDLGRETLFEAEVSLVIGVKRRPPYLPKCLVTP
jgi:hypothetical protein